MLGSATARGCFPRSDAISSIADATRRTFLPILVLPLLFTPSASPRGDAPAALEYEVKAAFLYHFAQFTDWPEAAFGETASTLVIGVLGDDPFGEALDLAVRGKTVQGRVLAIQRFAEAEDVGPCQILFVSSPGTRHLRPVLDALRGRQVLTVGETEHFLSDGGMVRFFEEDQRVRFEVNLDAAERSGLKISAKLLKVARVVRETGGKG